MNNTIMLVSTTELVNKIFCFMELWSLIILIATPDNGMICSIKFITSQSFLFYIWYLTLWIPDVHSQKVVSPFIITEWIWFSYYHNRWNVPLCAEQYVNLKCAGQVITYLIQHTRILCGDVKIWWGVIVGEHTKGMLLARSIILLEQTIALLIITWSLSLSTSSSRRPGSQSWNILTCRRVSRWTWMAISAFSLSGRADNTLSSSSA
jgi:hypothetical protein